MGQDNPAWHRQSQNARETASQEDEIDYGRENAAIAAGSFAELDVYNNSTGERVLLEVVGLATQDSYTEDIWATLDIADSGGGLIGQLDTNRVDFPLYFDPALPIPDGGEARLDTNNNTSSEIVAVGTGIVRFID